MKNFQGGPLDDAQNVHDFAPLPFWNARAVQIEIKHAVIQPDRTAGTYAPLRVVPGEEVEGGHVFLPKLGSRPGEVTKLQPGLR
ncbi:hypothetical protein D3C86_1957610 [compost metagenome]